MEKGFKESQRIHDGVTYPFDAFHIELSKNREIGCLLHFHQDIELIYVDNGSFDIWLDGKAYHALKGDLVIINSNECHKIQTSSENCRYRGIKCDPQIFYTIGLNLYDMKYVMPFLVNTSEHHRIFTKQEIENTEIPELMYNIHNEWKSKEYGFEISIRADLLKMFLIIVRHWNKIGVKINTLDISSSGSNAIQTAVEYVGKNYANASEAEAARLCGLSYSYFSHTFKRAMNLSFKEYVNYVRINESQKLLILENKSVLEISEMLGFSSPSHYIQSFKKVKGESPKQFKISYFKNFLNN